ncbi:MAG: hypothetical protein M0037_00480 [Betaproteobacteria bacterium]|nr:hypothetical protein [Betaproteobacteria bacterium]
MLRTWILAGALLSMGVPALAQAYYPGAPFAREDVRYVRAERTQPWRRGERAYGDGPSRDAYRAARGGRAPMEREDAYARRREAWRRRGGYAHAREWHEGDRRWPAYRRFGERDGDAD